MINLSPFFNKIKGYFARLFLVITRAIRSFSPREKAIFFTLLIILIISSLGLLGKLNQFFLVEIPARGGELKEGVIGAPRFINPLLAISDADRDLTALVYSGLLRATPDGELIPGLAESYSISDDGLTYIFQLKENLVWHDNVPLTSDDIVFTITKVKESILKSPKRASWEGVSIEKIDNKTIKFTLKQPYSPFLENTTLGILPRHLWESVDSQQFGFSTFNVRPIGSGPYRVRTIKKDSSGIPAYYDLVPFKHFSLGRPYINKLRIRFYANEEKLLRAFAKGEVETVNAILPARAREFEEEGRRVETYTLPRVFGVFFNQNKNTIFTKQVVRKALNEAVAREEIVEKVLFGYGTAISSPLPPGSLGFVPFLNGLAREKGAEIDRIESARDTLLKGGWRVNEETGIREQKTRKGTQTLEFSIVTSDAEELKTAARLIKETWEKIGARITLKIFNTGDLNQNVIRQRKYDALFFGEIIGRESDPFAFWHSSQRNDPGLNIALYANITADKLLEEGRTIFDKKERATIYKQFQEEIAKDIPAVFIYSPDFIYIIPHKIKGLHTGIITVPSERFLDIHTWYIETDNVWKIFRK